jgi:hypothetical protein
VHVCDGRFGIGFVGVEDIRCTAVRTGYERCVSKDAARTWRLIAGIGLLYLPMGRSRSSISPYSPKISRRCSSLIFLVKRSTTIWGSRWLV